MIRNRIFILTFLLLTSIFGSCQTSYHTEIKEYVDFLKKENVSAKDYILKQWEENDMVVVCERDHAEMTQYDLIQDVISSDYFVKNVGHVFIEVGSITVQDRLLKFLNTNYANSQQRENELVQIYRDFAWPIWDKSNSYFMLSKISEMNQQLKPEDKIQVYAIDEVIPQKGSVKSKEDFLRFEKEYQNHDRDSVMAENIIAKFDSIQSDSPRKKCMVIMNYRHAFLKNVRNEKIIDDGTPLFGNKIGTVPCVGSILANKFPNKVASVYVNAMTVGTPNGLRPIQGGKWDASFKVLAKEDVGFDFEKSPFGVDSLDIWGFSKPEHTYADVFTGMVYYLPFEKHIRAHGLENLIDQECLDEIYLRLKIYTELYGGEIDKKDMKDIFKYKEGTYWNLKECEEDINYWINKDTSTSQKQVKYAEEIAPYIDFLRNQNTSAKDYILSLFEQKDMLILSERLHPELTQYEMILDILRDTYFINNIGHIFIETCGRYQEENIKSYLNDSLTEDEAEKLLIHICRNNRAHPVWDYYNFYYFLKEVRKINSSTDKNIQIYPTDLKVTWKELDKTTYNKNVKAKFGDRDNRMADYIIKKYDAIQNGNSARKKALVIMNYRHAFALHFKNVDNVGGFLMDNYGDKVGNVMINSFTFGAYRSDTDFDVEPIQDGKWAAAFKALNKDDIGFDFTDNVFGNDHFDYWPYSKHNHVYSDVFDGMVFYKQTYEQKIVFGIPNLVDDNFLNEIKRREKIVNTPREDSVIWKMNEIEDRIHLFCTDSLKAKINQWLK
ncbi:hypothetical protein DF185_00325 [Marinifilum breve]|uniref:Uncharacterized protein n=1 Tax=Marinifilum breve TaxID=2184082 RepID=A0A2V4AEQ5_9BACT|nr:hypothetical protein [Marinifilum breve]PXY02574.1 hypothetical protein DF185_00325 [Marinifilum breve]